MKPNIVRVRTLTLLMAAALASAARAADPAQPSEADPLASWSEGSAKKAIVDFVARTTTRGSPHFVPAPERIALFDNDGTLWAEQPLPFQAFFVLDRVKALAPQHPEWKTEEPFASIRKGDPGLEASLPVREGVIGLGVIALQRRSEGVGGEP